ncbi:COX15/CtaA family protein [Negadavirga shengliensis]|uniref:Heme A synthase n=1 Tax=Negadavirga shengliensis TaxID=1389218 RepID=A0ABV9SUW6_9BACT
MKQKNLKELNSFRRISLITTVAVYFLILVGGIVRSTGAGMGCPDWPKCFGNWVPPTHVDELPADYEDLYVAKRVEKNNRFIAMLESLGFSTLAEDIRHDESILEKQPFNATKTWIEYVNRLVGVMIGIFIILTFVRSIRIRKIDPVIPLLSFAALVLVVFQGWLGSIVVSTNLLQWMISLHMVVALILVCLLLYIYFRARKISHPADKKEYIPSAGKYKWFMAVALILMLVQIVLGIQVREEIDRVATAFGHLFREKWIGELGLAFIIHRSYSLVLLLLHLVFGYMVYKNAGPDSSLYKNSLALIFLILTVILSGAMMAYFAIPAFIQPLHLLLGSLIIGVQFLIWLELGHYEKFDENHSVI